MLLPRRMLGRNVERREIVEIILDMRAFGHGKAEIAENLHHLFPHLGDRMDRAARLGARRQGHVDFFRSEALLKLRFLQHGLARRNRFRHLVLQHIERRTRRLALLRPHGAESFHLLGDRALLAKRCHAHRFERCFIGSAGHLLQDILFETHGNFGP